MRTHPLFASWKCRFPCRILNWVWDFAQVAYFQVRGCWSAELTLNTVLFYMFFSQIMRGKALAIASKCYKSHDGSSLFRLDHNMQLMLSFLQACSSDHLHRKSWNVCFVPCPEHQHSSSGPDLYRDEPWRLQWWQSPWSLLIHFQV